MSYQDTLDEIASGTAEQVVAAVAMFEAGQIDADTLAAVVVAFIAAGNGRAAALADLSLAAALTMALRSPVAPLGLTRPLSDTDRLAKAVRTLLAADEPSPARWERLARSEPLQAAAQAYSDGIARSPGVTGWTRGLEPRACQLCRWWWREGRVWPADHPMPTHPGCTCNPVPVVADQIRPVTTRRRTA